MGPDDAGHDGLHHRVQLRRGGDAAGRNDPAVPLPTADTTVQACDRRARPRCRERHHPTDHRVCRRRAGGAGESGVIDAVLPCPRLTARRKVFFL